MIRLAQLSSEWNGAACFQQDKPHAEQPQLPSGQQAIVPFQVTTVLRR